MQATLLQMPINEDLLWRRAAFKECIEYGEHGVEAEETDDGREICFNCGAQL